MLPTLLVSFFIISHHSSSNAATALLLYSMAAQEISKHRFVSTFFNNNISIPACLLSQLTQLYHSTRLKALACFAYLGPYSISAISAVLQFPNYYYHTAGLFRSDFPRSESSFVPAYRYEYNNKKTKNIIHIINNMPVTFLDVENFKSYAGRQTVGPFLDFTSVIGPNGSGKSNLMDAISFVLGVQSRDLRSSQMKDLIYRGPSSTQEGKKKMKQPPKLRAMVTLHYQDAESQEEIAFSRGISPAGQGEYSVNGQSMTFAKYEERLADIGVLVKARNFLVFQGDVESMARKTPKEMVTLLEQISTSIDLADDYDQALKRKEEAEAAVFAEYNRQKGFKTERRLLKEQKEDAEHFQELLEKKRQLQTDMYLWQLFHIDADIKEQEEALVNLRQEVIDQQKLEDAAAEALKAAKKKASAARRHTQKVDKDRVKAASLVDQMEPAQIQIAEEIKSLTKKIAMAESQLTKKQNDAKNHDGNLESLSQQIKERQEALAELERDYEEIKRDATQESVTLTEEQEEELETVRQAAAAATVEPRRTLAGLTRQLESQRAAAGNLAGELEEAKKTLAATKLEHARLVDRKAKLTSVRIFFLYEGISKHCQIYLFSLSHILFFFPLSFLFRISLNLFYKKRVKRRPKQIILQRKRSSLRPINPCRPR